MPQPLSEQDIHSAALALRSEFNNKNLKARVTEHVGQGASANDIFNVVALIKQWAKPCQRPIDMRSRELEAVVEKVAYEGIIHYLDPLTRQAFLDALAGYNGTYTFGVYESIIAFIDREQDRIHVNALASRFDLQPLQLGARVARSEERMNLGVRVSVFSSSLHDTPEDLCHADELDNVVTQEAVTVDISATGLQIRTSDDLKVNHVALQFTSFEDEYLFAQKLVVYKIVGKKRTEKDTFLFLKLLDLPHNSEFGQFAIQLIRNNKFRYKVSLDNTLESAQNRVYEQLLLPYYKGLAELQDSAYQGRLRTCSPLAVDVDQFFTSQNQSVLSSLLKAILPPLKGEYDEHTIIVFRRQHKDNPYQWHFYAAQLTQETQRFADFALSKDNSGLFIVRRRHIDVSALLKTSTLAGTVDNATAEKSRASDSSEQSAFKIAPKLPPLLSNLDILVTVDKVPDNVISKWSAQRDKFSKEEIQTFNQHLVSVRQNTNSQLSLLEITSSPTMQLPVRQSLNLKKDNFSINGYSTSLGIEQISVRCSQRMPFRKGDKVMLSTEYMATPGQPERLQANYRVLSIKGYTVNLVVTAEHAKLAQQYWLDLLTWRNIPVVQTYNDDLPHGVCLAMRNVVAKYHDSVPAFLSTRKNMPCTVKVAISDTHRLNDNAFCTALEKAPEAMKKQLWYASQFLDALSLLIKQNEKEGDHVGELFLAIALEPRTARFQRFKIWQMDELDSEKFLLFKKINSTSTIVAGWLSVHRAYPLFDKYYRDELKYVGKYAPHKAKKLLSEAEKTSFIAQWHDMSLLTDYLFPEAS
ncbi:PilZ domain-containing protein [Aestuariibacter salexigens]|uniref:PilZ domain-containing protein n=1 Tax=Aestuariibacter salexigens TaxID=226010 RepID=UPI000413E21D|nr:PilZ domain-containing protein [Aestuariibacter salexigens]